MDFRPSPDQLDLQEGIRSFCVDRLSLESLRSLEQTDGFDRTLWGSIAELGVLSMRLDEARGGLGLGCADAVLVFEELGRALAPGPLAWSQLAAGLIPGAADGRVVVGGVDRREAGREPCLVEHSRALDALLVLRSDGVFRVDPAELELEHLAPLDPLTPVAHVASLPIGERVAGAEAARAMWLEGLCLTAGQLLGVAEAMLQIALEYAKEREQFGRSIGSFQAVKHMLADMFARQELARASVYAAGAIVDHPDAGSPEQAARGAKIVAAVAAAKNARACIQIHGGMGYTWEVADHYYLKRARVLDTQLGDVDEHAEGIAAAFD